MGHTSTVCATQVAVHSCARRMGDAADPRSQGLAYKKSECASPAVCLYLHRVAKIFTSSFKEIKSLLTPV